jgi:hypothetical protein
LSTERRVDQLAEDSAACEPDPHDEGWPGTGPLGEDIAAKYLVEQGLVILDGNWRTPASEIDIIARDVNAFVIVEQETSRFTSAEQPRRGASGSSALRGQCPDRGVIPVIDVKVVPGHLLDQSGHLDIDGRAAQPVRVSPMAGHQTPMPGERGGRGDQAVRPQRPWQQPDEGGKHATIGPVQPRT